MINVNSSIIENEEYRKASENLPNVSHVVACVESSNINPDYDFFLIGRDENGLDKNTIYYFNNKQIWINHSFLPPVNDNCVDDFYIHFDDVDENIKYIDLFLQDYKGQRLNPWDPKFKEFILKFETEDNKDIFSYSIKNKKKKKHLFCGIFAKVSDGWKFYPRFQEHDLEMEEVLKKYDKIG